MQVSQGATSLSIRSATRASSLHARELDVQVFRARSIGRDERKIDIGLESCSKVRFWLFQRLLSGAGGPSCLCGGRWILFFEFIGQPVDDALVEVTAAQERVAVGGFHFENAIAHFQDGDIESTAAQVEHRDLVFFGLFIESVSESCRRRLVDDAFDVETRDAAGVFGGLALSIVEVGREP